MPSMIVRNRKKRIDTSTENEERCLRAEKALSFYEDIAECNLIDLLTDLRHWCRREKISFGNAITMSEIHYHAEIKEG